MKIAVPVHEDSVTFFSNAGHTPKFAVYEMNGSGMFRSFQLLDVKNNPRTDLDHHDEDHQCDHDHADEAHIQQHLSMGEVLQGCDYLVVQRACKNTVNAMKEHHVKVVKYNGKATKSDAILNETAASFL